MVLYKKDLSDLEKKLGQILAQRQSFSCFVCVAAKGGSNDFWVYGQKKVFSPVNIHEICCLAAGAEMLYGAQSIFLLVAEENFQPSKAKLACLDKIIADWRRNIS